MTTKSEREEFQKNLKHEREARGISQTTLAREIGVSQPHMHYIEIGKRSLTPERYKYILEAFGRQGTVSNSRKKHAL